ncbi:hypothetical protein BaRGS_00019002 [Batillaria attramentaria]|uniref:Uncharacterized protein n=1 Tax=Batillaria attramentaria TaxID=370345 RepID=A0ABD0KSP9_9CAEN
MCYFWNTRVAPNNRFKDTIWRQFVTSGHLETLQLHYAKRLKTEFRICRLPRPGLENVFSLCETRQADQCHLNERMPECPNSIFVVCFAQNWKRNFADAKLCTQSKAF